MPSTIIAVARHLKICQASVRLFTDILRFQSSGNAQSSLSSPLYKEHQQYKMPQMEFGYPQFALAKSSAQVLSMVYSPCQSVDKTNWYTCLLQLEHIADPDQLDQDHQYIKAIEQYLKIKAKRSPQLITYKILGLCKLYCPKYMGGFPYKTLHNQRFIGCYF